MKIRGLLIMLAILIGLAAFVYFYEIQGGKRRTEQEKAQKRIVQVEESQVQEIAIFSGEQQIRGKREGDQWRIVQPIEAEGDQYEWNAMSRGMHDMVRDKDLEGGTEDLKSYGLDKPRLRVVTKTSDGKEHQILFGDENPTQSFVYVKTPQNPTIMLVATYSFRLFEKKLFDLREKSVLKADQSEIQEVILHNPAGAIQLRKKGEEWEVQAPIQAKADKSEVDSFLGSVTGGRVKEFIDQPDPTLATGFDKPTYELTFWTGKDRAMKRLVVGALKFAGTPSTETPTEKPKGEKPAKEEKPKELPFDATFYARDDSRKSLLVVEKSFIDKLNKKLADFRDKTILTMDRSKLKQIEISYDTKKITLVKSGDDWLTADKKKKAKSDLMTPLLAAVEYTKVKSLIDPPYDSAKLGLDAPEVKVSFEYDGLPKQEFWIGKDSDDGTYARVVGETTVKVLEKDVKGKLKLKAADLLIDNAPAKK